MFQNIYELPLYFQLAQSMSTQRYDDDLIAGDGGEAIDRWRTRRQRRRMGSADGCSSCTIGMELILDVGTRSNDQRGARVLKRSRDNDGRPVGRAHSNKCSSFRRN